jgi:hypothetical protein
MSPQDAHDTVVGILNGSHSASRQAISKTPFAHNEDKDEQENF